MMWIVVVALSRGASGSIGDVAPIKMSFQQAYEYCSKQSARLPQIYEYLDFAVAHGAIGVLASKVSDQSPWSPAGLEEWQRNFENGYDVLIYKRHGNGISPDFYFNHRHYQKPDSSWAKSFWTSSLDASSEVPKGFVFYGEDGQLLDGQDLDSPHSVRCVN